jgi:hypothetical protein
LEELQEKEHAEALQKDITAAKARQEAEALQTDGRAIPTSTHSRVPAKEEFSENCPAEPYNIVKDICSCSVNATVGQLLEDNPKYQKQVKEILTRRRKRQLPKVGLEVDVRMICEDLGAPELDCVINNCRVRYAPVDGGSGVNIMIDTTAEQLGYHELQPTARAMRLANGARVIPKGVLVDVPTIIADREYLLNFLVLQPSRPSAFPLLIGRPWLYGAGVCEDWTHQEFRF